MGTIPRTPDREGHDPRAENGYIHCGPAGSGHFVKMVHNGIEYGLMQAYAEGFDILRNKSSRVAGGRAVRPQPHRHRRSVAARQRGLVMAARSLRHALDQDATHEFSGSVADSGEGHWTIEAAMEEAVPADVLSTALFARFRSRRSILLAKAAIGDALRIRRPCRAEEVASDQTTLQARARSPHIRPNFFITATNWSCGSATLLLPSRPTIVSLAIMLSMIASSVTSIVATNKGSMSCVPIASMLRSLPRGAANAILIGRREGKENVARTVVADAAGPRQAQGHAPGDALELMRFERRIGRDDDDDRTHGLAAQFITLEVNTDGHAEDGAFRPLAEIRLHQSADGIASAQQFSPSGTLCRCRP